MMASDISEILGEAGSEIKKKGARKRNSREGGLPGRGQWRLDPADDRRCAGMPLTILKKVGIFII
jgi:hypothetical protein